MSMNALLFLIVYVVLNVIAFAMYVWDKHKAKTDQWRTKESTLLIAEIGRAHV